jgi:hypothetical protein
LWKPQCELKKAEKEAKSALLTQKDKMAPALQNLKM